MAGAVVVPGNLVVQSNVKAIQHPTGGVVAEIPVHNGQRVGTGDLLLRLANATRDERIAWWRGLVGPSRWACA